MNQSSSHKALHVAVVDTDYMRPGLAASYLLIHSGRAAFVDTGTSQSVPRLLAALTEHGLKPQDVDYVLLTHVHLDHAGGAGTLMQQLPAATCIVHPRGARHMVDPAKLIAGSMEVYGEQAFRRLYGDIPGIAAERVVTVEDGQRLTLGELELEFIHTAGHALHHYCIVDRADRTIFSGDSFGVSYREFDTVRGAFIFPTTTPVQFDPDAAHATVERLMSYTPVAIYPTHFGRLEQLGRLAQDLHAALDAFVAIAHRHADRADRKAYMAQDMFEYLSQGLDVHGHRSDAAARHQLLDNDIELNVQGLDVWLARRS